MDLERRDLFRLAALGGGLAFASGLGFQGAKAKALPDFSFVQLSDTHWGFAGAPNPEAKTTLPRAVAAVNAIKPAPDFVVFTGDLTHTTDDPAERRRRMAEFKRIIGELAIKDVRCMPGEHDAALDRGEAYKEFFGAANYSFDHKGVHFIALDNVTEPDASLGKTQLAWLADDLARRAKDDPIVVFAHRPLFDLAADWDWSTADGTQAIQLLTPFENVVVFYGHIHQEHHHMTGHIAHHAAKSLIFPLPAPHSVPRKGPVAWDPAHPFRGLGFRDIRGKGADYDIAETGIA